MGLFNRKNNGQDSSNSEDSNAGDKKEKGGWKRPANTAFKQQRLKAWQPILTPKTVLPTFFIISILFAPIGGLLIWGSSLVSEISIDYTDCDSITPITSLSDLSNADSLTQVPSDKVSYNLRASDSNAPPPAAARYAYFKNDSAPLQERNQCFLQFDVPANLGHTVLLYYKLTNFYQNHRRYVKSFNSDQLKGRAVSVGDLRNSDCRPLDVNADGKPIYPCGLIANSIFNDTFSNLTLLGSSDTYILSSKGIAWPGESKKYTNKVDYDLSAIVPPPNWQDRFPNNYTAENFPQLQDDEHFQNWMRTAGLPTFTKLYGRNDNDDLVRGRYQIVINLNYPVKSFRGTKSIVISTVSWIGGKNPFLGWAYVAASGVFMLLAIAGLARHLIKPRKLGDMSQLSWNR